MSSNNNDLSKVFQSSFPPRVKSYWNVLPMKIENSKSFLNLKKPRILQNTKQGID